MLFNELLCHRRLRKDHIKSEFCCLYAGYYMFIESSSPRMENDTARLYSPIYTSQLNASQPSCFIFWYHMYGSTTGTFCT